MKRSLSYIIIGIFAAVSAFAQTDVKSYKGGETEGVTYYLPNTALDITVEAVEITRTPGEFAAYAGKYLHINNAITKDTRQRYDRSVVRFFIRSPLPYLIRYGQASHMPT